MNLPLGLLCGTRRVLRRSQHAFANASETSATATVRVQPPVTRPSRVTPGGKGSPISRLELRCRSRALRTESVGIHGQPREMTMTKQADCKRRVRVRTAKTGESYATARNQILAERPDTAAFGPVGDGMSAALHVSYGDATDLPGTGLVERVLCWRDVLREGPVTAAEPEELRRIRAAFLLQASWDDGSALAPTGTASWQPIARVRTCCGGRRTSTTSSRSSRSSPASPSSVCPRSASP